MKITKSLLTAGLIGSFAFSMSAQAPEDAFVDENGNLIIGDQTIAPPDGTVDENGNLVIDGETITAPDATVQDDGSLVLDGGQTTLDVPTFPEGGEFIVDWFGDDLLPFEAATDVNTSQWYFSFTYKSMYHYADSNWFYSQEMDAGLYFDPSSANRTLEDGVWVYSDDLIPDQEDGVWIFLAQSNDFYDLRDADEDGVNDLEDSEAGSQVLDGSVFVVDLGWFWFSEYDEGDDPGNFLISLDDNSVFFKLTDPVE